MFPTDGIAFNWMMAFLHFGGWLALLIMIWQFRGMLDRVKKERENTTTEIRAVEQLIKQMQTELQTFETEAAASLKKNQEASLLALQNISQGIATLVAIGGVRK